MRTIGLTGGIASGKSTVSKMLSELGAHVIDADALAREVVEPGTPALKEIARRFPGVVGADGRLDRAQLADRIFGQEQERLALNAIVHPRVQEAYLNKAQALAKQGTEVIIYDAALLLENGLDRKMDGVILVTVPREVQISRLIARNGLTRDEAEARIASQMPLEEKAKRATWLVDNSGDLAATRARIAAIWNEIRQSE
jgi:dephospho-CoA kinase